MDLAKELPRLLRESGIATAEQAEDLADRLVDLLQDDDWSQEFPESRERARRSIQT